MSWSTVAFFGIGVVLLVALLWFVVAIYAFRKQREMMREMDEDFEKRRQEMRGQRFGR